MTQFDYELTVVIQREDAEPADRYWRTVLGSVETETDVLDAVFEAAREQLQSNTGGDK